MKTLGEIAFEAAQSFDVGPIGEYRHLDGKTREAWEAAASAVIGECIKTVTDLLGNPQMIKLHMGEMSAQEMRTLNSGFNLIAYKLLLQQSTQAGLKSAESATPSAPQAECQHDT